MTISSTPIVIRLVLLFQFIGVFMLGLSTMTVDPLYLAITISGGSGFITLAIVTWIVLLVREVWGFVAGLDKPGAHQNRL